VTLDELRRQAEHATWAWEGLERDAEDAEEQVLRAREAGDALLERQWQERAEQRQKAADRAWERAEEAEEAVTDAEYEADYPEEAAAERAAADERMKDVDARRKEAGVQLKEICGTLLRNGTISPEFYAKMTSTPASR
jgi:hypothetical protein